MIDTILYMKKISKIYKCSCYAEAIEIEREDDFVSICFWEIGVNKNNKPSLKHRIWIAWKALTGTLYTDECMLDLETASILGKDLQEIAAN